MSVDIGSIQPGGTHETPSSTGSHATRLANVEAVLEMTRRRVGVWWAFDAGVEIYQDTIDNLRQTPVSQRIERLEAYVKSLTPRFENLETRVTRIEERLNM